MKPLSLIASPLLCGLLALPSSTVLAAPGGGEVDDADEVAPADDPPLKDPAARAREAYERGTELYNAAKFEEALEAFEEAATLFASPDFQYNIARCYERLGKLEEAIHHYETYLRTADEPPDRAAIEASIAMMKQQLEDDAQRPDDPEPERQDPNAGRPLVIAGGVLIGVGVAAGLGGGLGFGIPVARDNQTLGRVVGEGNPDGLTFDEADAIADRARTNQTLEIVLAASGGAIAVVGVALLAVGMKKNKAARSANEAATEGAPASRLQVAPYAGLDGAGLIVKGAF